jgi:hypothetical protein
MQTNMFDDEPQSIFVFRNPLRFLSRKGRQIGAYLSGGLVSLLSLFFFEVQLRRIILFSFKLAVGWWAFIDAVINSAKYNGESKMGFEDWFSGILTTFGMIV